MKRLESSQISSPGGQGNTATAAQGNVYIFSSIFETNWQNAFDISGIKMEMERGYSDIFSPQKIVLISFCSDFIIPVAYYNVAVLFDLCVGTYSATA